MTREQIRTALIDAHRVQNWDLAAKLSQLREKAKKMIRCMDCGCKIREGLRCRFHANRHRYYGKSLTGIRSQ